MVGAAQMFTVGIPTLAVLSGILVNNGRFDDLNGRIQDLRQDVSRRFDDVDCRLEDSQVLLRAEFLRVEQVLDARLKHLEDNS